MGIDAVIQQYFAFANQERWHDLRELFHPDATLLAVGARPRQGRDDVMTYFDQVFAAWPQHHDQPGLVIASDNSAAVEIAFTGTGHDGRRIHFDAVDVFHFAPDARISRLTSWYDIAYVQRFLRVGRSA